MSGMAPDLNTLLLLWSGESLPPPCIFMSGGSTAGLDVDRPACGGAADPALLLGQQGPLFSGLALFLEHCGLLGSLGGHMLGEGRHQP